MFQEGCVDTDMKDSYICKTNYCNIGSFASSCNGQAFHKAKAGTAVLQGGARRGKGNAGESYSNNDDDGDRREKSGANLKLSFSVFLLVLLRLFMV